MAHGGRALDLYCGAARRFGMPVEMKRAILTDVEQGLPHVYHNAWPEPFLRQAYDELIVDAYAYGLDSPAHGPCRVEFSFARNAVTELRVLDVDGDTLAAMRPTIDGVLRH